MKPWGGALFGIARAHIYVPYFPCGKGNLRLGFFEIECRILGGRRSNDSKSRIHKERVY